MIATPTAKPITGRALGCLLGVSIGDQLGYPIEFQRGPFPAEPPTSLYWHSDDTQMTLFVAEGLVLDGPVLGGQLRALLRWYYTQNPVRVGSPRYFDAIEEDRLAAGLPRRLLDDPRMIVDRAPGSTCMSALAARALANGGDEPARNDSAGCGAVMRAAPYGLVNGVTRQGAFALACAAGQLTHGNVRGWLPAGFLAATVWGLVRGEPLPTALRLAEGLCAQAWGDQHPLLKLLNEAINIGASGRFMDPAPGLARQLGDGWVGDQALAWGVAAAAAVWDAETPPSPQQVRQALWRAAAHPGDSDSTAAIAGGIIGAMAGVARLPQEWVDGAEMGLELRGLALALSGA